MRRGRRAELRDDSKHFAKPSAKRMRALPPRWQRACGFYSGSSDLSEHVHGMAESFDQARVAFEAAWRNFLARRH